MNQRKAFGLGGALLVHILVLYFVLPKAPPPPPPDPPMTMVDLDDRSVNHLVSTDPMGKGESCADISSTYDGIGILYQLHATYGEVLEVGKGTSADLGGIEVGDHVDPDLFMIVKLKAGKKITFWVERHGIRRVYTLTAGKICYR